MINIKDLRVDKIFVYKRTDENFFVIDRLSHGEKPLLISFDAVDG